VSDPDTVVQNVEVPVEARTCPSSPVLLLASAIGPVKLRRVIVVVAKELAPFKIRLVIVVVASVEVPFTSNVEEVKTPPFAFIEKTFDPVESCTWKRLAI
jgi:hypothetical protein